MKNCLFGKDSSKDTISLIPMTERKRFLGDVFWAYYEIFISLENMKMISVFVRQYPNYKSYKTQKITKCIFRPHPDSITELSGHLVGLI